MTELLITAASLIAALSMPVLYLTERLMPTRAARLTHLALLLIGGFSLFAVSVTLSERLSALPEDVGLWASGFIYGLFAPVVISGGILVLLLSVAAALRHPMVRTRRALASLIPITVLLAANLIAALADGGQFDVALGIRALAPSVALLSHAVSLCEREREPVKKSPKNR